MEQIKQSHIEHICSRCAIGTPLGVPRPVRGGLLHRMWCLSTTRGTFALKQLNPAIMSRTGIHEAYRQSERIATDIAAHGLPAVAAHRVDDDPLIQCGDEAFLVYTWIEGTVLTPGAVDSQQAYIMGKLLARIHALKLHYPDQPTLLWKHFEHEHWDMLTFQAADQTLPWAYSVRTFLPTLHAWSQAYQEAGSQLSQHLVTSHRDLDPKNVLWQDAATPYLIDWEAGGFINPTMELAGMALDWSEQTTGNISEEIFMAVIAGYREEGGMIGDPGLVALHGFLGTRLGWLLFNMRRSLGESVVGESERQLGVEETTKTLATLRAMANKLETWAGWIDKSR